MISTNDLKLGITLLVDNNLFTVLEFQHVKPGKGPAFVRTKLKNVRTGATVDKTFNAGVKVEQALINKVDMQYLYEQNNEYYFMNMESYEQLSLTKDILGNDLYYLKEGIEVTLSTYQDEVLGLIFPDKIELVVTMTEPGVKGNTINNTYKDATLETGLELKVPLFIDQGETIIISTKDGKYSSRA